VDDLAPIAGLANLRTLCLDNTRVADLAPIAGLANLRTLWLDNTQVADLAPIAGLANLQELYLNDTQVTDLAPIAGLDVAVHIGGQAIRPKQWAREGRSLKIGGTPTPALPRESGRGRRSR
jgi:Leucine-rich repeat (LRR) protein